MSPWQQYCQRVHEHRVATIPNYQADLDRRSAEFVERVKRMEKNDVQ